MWIAKASAPLAVAWGRLTRSRPIYTPESLRIVCDNAIFDTAKAREELGYHPRPIEETLRDTWKWMALDEPHSPLKPDQ
jgi:dihydroflavonol-4-reductase